MNYLIVSHRTNKCTQIHKNILQTKRALEVVDKADQWKITQRYIFYYFSVSLILCKLQKNIYYKQHLRWIFSYCHLRQTFRSK